jgi:glycosyltransferase involved in cell wall biosynthesis
METTGHNGDSMQAGAVATEAFAEAELPREVEFNPVGFKQKDLFRRFFESLSMMMSAVMGKLRGVGNLFGRSVSIPSDRGWDSGQPSDLRSASINRQTTLSKETQPLRVGFLLRKFDCEDGIASHCETLMRQLNRLGVEIVVFVGRVSVEPGTQARFDALQSLAVKWVQIPLPKRRLNPGFSAARVMAAEIKKMNVSVLHMHGMGTLLMARLACLRSRTPIVATVHLSPEVSAAGPHAAMAKIARPFLSRFWPTRLIAISSEIRKVFGQQYAISEQRIDTIFNGVDASHFRLPTPEERSAARQSLGLADDDFVVSHVGRLAKVKGHDVLFKAAAKLVDAHPKMKVICRGSGPELPELETMCTDLKIVPNVKFLGHGDSRVVYWASDVFVLPSRREGFPLVVIEAMLCGAVPIRTPAAGAKDQIDSGVNGFIFPFEDSAALARNIELLINDGSALARMRENSAHSALARFDSALMASKTLDAYRKAIDKNQN